MTTTVFKKYVVCFLLLQRVFVLHGSTGDYLTDPTPQYISYELDDKKILELNETSAAYYAQEDTNINTILTINDIKYSDKGSFNTKDNWKKTKLIDYFKQIVLNLTINNPAELSTYLKNFKERFYYQHSPAETYYGVNYQLIGNNLIGKIAQAMRDDPTYIPRIQQKIEVSDALIKILSLKATQYNTVNKTSGWAKTTPKGYVHNSNAIYFYNANKSYYEFTNFFASPVYVDGVIWPTSEHYYQSMKFTNNATIRQTILTKLQPRDAFNVAQANSTSVDRDWQDRSLKTMIKVVWLKFNQHETLKDLLLKTQNKTLIEDAGKNDRFYGAGDDYKGDNWLGCILMAVRDQLAQQKLAEKKQETLQTKKPNTPQSNADIKKSLQSVTKQKLFRPVPAANQSRPVVLGQQNTQSRKQNPAWQLIIDFFSWLFGWST
ncbi:NADAR family protein [Candidatus Dependentiae bacterium]|nr:MAG: NADAR family protein [Candidatus Dependentiae bacterium]